MNGIFYYLDGEKSRIFYGDENADASKGTVLQRILRMEPCGLPREKLDNRGELF